MRAKNCASVNGIQVSESANCSAFSIYTGIVSGHVWDRTRPQPWNLKQLRWMRSIQVKMLWNYWYHDRRSEAPLYIKRCRTERTLCFQSTLSQSLFRWIVEKSEKYQSLLNVNIELLHSLPRTCSNTPIPRWKCTISKTMLHVFFSYLLVLFKLALTVPVASASRNAASLPRIAE